MISRPALSPVPRGACVALALASLFLVVGCGADSETTDPTKTEAASVKSEAKERPPRNTVAAARLTGDSPEKRVMQCIALEGGFIEPLAPTRHKREPPSHSFAHGVGPGESHIAIYLGTSPQEIDDWIEEYDQFQEYRATKTADGRNLILLDVYADPLDREVAFHCIAAATR
jgi:hypothetical protein